MHKDQLMGPDKAASGNPPGTDSTRAAPEKPATDPSRKDVAQAKPPARKTGGFVKKFQGI